MYHSNSGTRTIAGAEAKLIRRAIAYCVEAIMDVEDDEAVPEFGVVAFDRLSRGQQIWLLVHTGEALLDASVPEPELTQANESCVAALYEIIKDCVAFEIENDTFELRNDPIDDPENCEWRKMVLDAIELAERNFPPIPDEKVVLFARNALKSDDPDVRQLAKELIRIDAEIANYVKARDDLAKWYTESLEKSSPELFERDVSLMTKDISHWSEAIESLRDHILWDEDWDDEENFIDGPPAFNKFLQDVMAVGDDYFSYIPPDPRDDELPQLVTRLSALTRELP